jgi:hypothetical protein
VFALALLYVRTLSMDAALRRMRLVRQGWLYTATPMLPHDVQSHALQTSIDFASLAPNAEASIRPMLDLNTEPRHFRAPQDQAACTGRKASDAAAPHSACDSDQGLWPVRSSGACQCDPAAHPTSNRATRLEPETEGEQTAQRDRSDLPLVGDWAAATSIASERSERPAKPAHERRNDGGEARERSERCSFVIASTGPTHARFWYWPRPC